MAQKNYKYTAMLCYIGAFMGPFGGNVINVLLPRLQVEFATSFYNISLSISIYMIAFAAFQLVSGLVSDILGRRNVILFGYGGFSLGCVICFLAGNLGTFLAGRFIQGMCNAFMTPVLMALLGDVVPKDSLGKHMGLFGSVQTSGSFLAPIAGGIFAEINWRYSFFILAFLSFILTFIYYKMFGYESRAAKRRLKAKDAYGALRSNKGILLLSMSSFLGYFGFGSLSFLFSKYIYLRLDVSEFINGVMVSMTGFASILFSPAAGKIGDRFNRGIVCAVGAASIMPLIFIIPYIGNPYLLGSIFFVMGGFSALVWSSLNTIAVDTMPEIRGTISSIVNSFKYFSFSISPVFYGKLFEKVGIEGAFAAASAVTFIQVLVMITYTIYARRKVLLQR